jgi:hypothetical protein
MPWDIETPSSKDQRAALYRLLGVPHIRKSVIHELNKEDADDLIKRCLKFLPKEKTADSKYVERDTRNE